MSNRLPPDVDVDYLDGTSQDASDYPHIETKIQKALDVIEIGLREYENPALMWTGGKDSTVVLYFVKEVAERFDLPKPQTIFIDHFQHFEDIHGFVSHWSKEWDFTVEYASNDDIGAYIKEHNLQPGDDIPVDALNEHNRHHIEDILEYEEDSFPFLLDTYAGNHLLKTVALNDVLESHAIDGVISGVRWDEQEARSDETFFSPRHDPDIYPPHDRIQPILQFDEAAIWNVIWNYIVPDTVSGYPEEGYVPTGVDDLPEGVSQQDIPVSPKYWEGFRSLGSEVSTKKSADEPAWLQDLEGTVERAGRAQDKEDLMERLRDLGYM